MVVQRRHAEDPLATGEFEIEHLRRHGQGFGDKHAAHDRQHDFLTNDDGHSAECAAQRQRTDVAHEDFCRISVEPQETEPGPGHRTKEDAQLASARHVGHEQVLGIDGIAGNVGEDGQRGRHHHGRHDRQTVETVGQIDCVRGANDDEVGQDHEADDPQWVSHCFEEGNDQFELSRQRCRHAQIDGDDDTDHRLPEIFPARGQAFRVAVDHLLPIVDPANGTEADGHDQHHPHVAVGEVGPQQRGDGDGDQNQHAAHGRRSGFGEMGLRPVSTHCLADFLGCQPADDAWPGNEGNHQGRHRR